MVEKAFRWIGFPDRIHFGENVDTTREPWPLLDTSGSDIVLGDYVQLSSGTYIHTHSHQFTKKNWRELPIIENRVPTLIGNYVFIGVNAQIMHTCKVIGDYSVIAAGAIVTENVPACEIWGGVPARKIGDVE